AAPAGRRPRLPWATPPAREATTPSSSSSPTAGRGPKLWKRGRTCSRRTDSAATVETAARGRWRQPLDRVACHRGGAHQRALKARRSPSPRLPWRQPRRRNMMARGGQAVSARGKARDSPATRRILPETNRVVENIQGGIAMNRRRFMYSVAAGGAGAALIAARVAALAEADGAATTKRFAD